MAQIKPIRYGKPCMTNLPPKLGRQIIREILFAKPSDNSSLEEENRRVLAKLAVRIEKMKRQTMQRKKTDNTEPLGNH
ncbi:MAG: hypothetical protein J6W23_05010 [Victivallales bacterium]|nr:hypothetical protein [Victivallales bacterium]MBO7533234.1 hypothetical protein [Victivallales bacterium]